MSPCLPRQTGCELVVLSCTGGKLAVRLFSSGAACRRCTVQSPPVTTSPVTTSGRLEMTRGLEGSRASRLECSGQCTPRQCFDCKGTLDEGTLPAARPPLVAEREAEVLQPPQRLTLPALLGVVLSLEIRLKHELRGPHMRHERRKLHERRRFIMKPLLRTET